MALYLIECAALTMVILLTSAISVQGLKRTSLHPSGRTGYACEGNKLELLCEEGSINIVRGNYGRYSISICNDHGNLDWKVDCTWPQTYTVLSQRCNGKASCSMLVSSQDFDDPCPGTRKYLEVQYQCNSANGTSSSPGGHHNNNNKLLQPPSFSFSPSSSSSSSSSPSLSASSKPIKDVLMSRDSNEKRNWLQSANGTMLAISNPKTNFPVLDSVSSSVRSGSNSTFQFASSSSANGASGGGSSSVNSASSTVPIRDTIAAIESNHHQVSQYNKNRTAHNGVPVSKSVLLSPPSPSSSSFSPYATPTGSSSSLGNAADASSTTINGKHQSPAIIAPLTQLDKTDPPSIPVNGGDALGQSGPSSPSTGQGNGGHHHSGTGDRLHPSQLMPSVTATTMATSGPGSPIRMDSTRDFWDEYVKEKSRSSNNVVSSGNTAGGSGVDLAPKSIAFGRDDRVEGGQDAAVTALPEDVSRQFPAVVVMMGTTVIPDAIGSSGSLGPGASAQLPPQMLSEQDETYKMLLVIISCLVAVIFCCLTVGLLIASRTRCNRLTVYKNLCLNLILLELALVLIVYRPALEVTHWSYFLVPFVGHLLLLNIFIWSFLESLRVYCIRSGRSCDISGILSCTKCLFPPSVCLYIVAYGLPFVSALALGSLYPEVYIGHTGRHYAWLTLGTLDHILWAFWPALLSVIMSLVVLSMAAMFRPHIDDKGLRDINGTGKERSLLPPLIILACQVPSWLLVAVYFHKPSSSILYTGSLALINIVQSVILFVLCFSQNDRVRGDIQSSLNRVTWLPQCVRTGKSAPGNLVSSSSASSSPQTPAYFYSLDPTHLGHGLPMPPGPLGAGPPSPLIRSQMSHLQQHRQLSLADLALVTAQNRTYSTIPEVNPYAAPVPVMALGSGSLSSGTSGTPGQGVTLSGGPSAAMGRQGGHEYEDIGTALQDMNSFGVPMAHNLGQRGTSTMSTRGSHGHHHHHQSLRRSIHVEDDHRLYYEPNVLGNELQEMDGQVTTYGGSRNNAPPNYCFHNTRSPIYYSETTRR
ncbi:Latrophilin Cirl [Halotydeus destructor]|nr:Latrophilin Cirl [Halotydeus destructor]